MIRLVDLHDGARIREGALEFLYQLMVEREPEINISHRELPTFEQHRQFVTRRPYRFWYLIEVSSLQRVDAHAEEHKEWAGYISATHENEIGIVLIKAHRGKGIGPDAVRQLMKLHRPNPAQPTVRNGHWLANIAPANERSHRMFVALGFRQIQNTYEFNEEESHGKEADRKAASA